MVFCSAAAVAIAATPITLAAVTLAQPAALALALAATAVALAATAVAQPAAAEPAVAVATASLSKTATAAPAARRMFQPDRRKRRVREGGFRAGVSQELENRE